MYDQLKRKSIGLDLPALQQRTPVQSTMTLNQPTSQVPTMRFAFGTTQRGTFKCANWVRNSSYSCCISLVEFENKTRFASE